MANILTPDEYIRTYSDKLKEDLTQYDIQVNKLGIIGYMLNLLGWTQYDAKNYADNLFKEAFVATAKKDSNLHVHSSIFGYTPGFATPSTAYGNFTFDFSMLPRKSTDIGKREIIFTNISFKIGDYTFRTDSEYRFTDDIGTFYCVIYSASGKVKYIPSSTSKIVAPFIDIYQNYKQDTEIIIQPYDFGMFYPYEFSLQTGFLSDISLEVEENLGSGVYNQYEIKNVKYFESSFSRVVFLTLLETRKYLLEFGSGVRGNYIPNKNVKITKYITDGKDGNLNTAKSVKMERSLITRGYKYKIDGLRDNLGGTLRDLLLAEFEYSDGGKDILFGEDLRGEIISFIQSRDNLISRQDYYNIAEKYGTDFEFYFNKTSFLDNIFYVNFCLRDNLKKPIRSFSKIQQLLEDYTIPPILSKTEIQDDSYTLVTGSYNYFILASDCFGNTVSSNLVIANIVNPTSNGVRLTWNIVPDAVKYLIYGRPDLQNNYQYWETVETTFIDTGTDGNLARLISPANDKVIFYPTTMDNGEEYVSPFIYKLNTFLNIYEGYILNSHFLVNIADVKNRNIDYSLPTLYFRFYYDKYQYKTHIQVKSHQNIDGYNFILTVHGINIIDVNMTYVDSNTYEYIYEDDNYGLIFESVFLELFVRDLDTEILHVSTDTIFQLYDMTDILKASVFKDNDSINYVTNLSYISKEVFENNTDYYLRIIKDFLYSFNLKERRMITDEIQSKFLNTNIVIAYYLKYTTIQGYDSFDLKLPLKLEIECLLDKELIVKSDTDIDVSKEKDDLLVELGKKLQTDYTGSQLKFYNSKIVDFIHTDRFFIKKVIVTVKDSNNNIILNGIETRPNNDILNLILKDESNPSDERKLNVLKYSPIFWYWDVDNISLKFLY